MIRSLFAALMLALFLNPSVAPAAGPTAAPSVNSGLARIQLDVARHAIRVEVADTPATREIGLMNRFSIPPDEGMVFVFRQPQPLSFWMRNTFAPLSIAFVDAGGRILNIEDMAPQSDDAHLSKGMALYALEMRQGWFKRNGIEAGARIGGLPKASAQ